MDTERAEAAQSIWQLSCGLDSKLLDFQQEQETFLFSETSSLALQHFIQWVPGGSVFGDTAAGAWS